MAFNTLIKKTYHFYSAHRNENLVDKCKNLHGHTYLLEVSLDFNKSAFDSKTGTFLNFGKIDSIIEPIVRQLDHATFVSSKDLELMKCVEQFPDIFGKVVMLPEATSVENLGLFIGNLLNTTDLNFYLHSVSIKETTSSEVITYF